MNATPAAIRWLSLTMMAGLLAGPVLAQGVHRIVGPDGKVTFSDQPPHSAPQRSSGATSSGASSAGPSGSQLPYELRQISSRFPVTLYTGRECAPCNSGRNLLNARGIPYSEKTVESVQDAEALKRLSGEASLPFLTIGGQQIKGYSDGEWTQFLDAAGYPKQSTLPSNYRRPAASPLATAASTTPANRAAQGSPDTSPSPADVPVTPTPDNPAGIRF